MAWLDRAGERRPVESETRIGRGEHNHIRLNHPSISRDHALIRRVDGAYVLSDLDSANGTFVNDERVFGPRALAEGDLIRLAGLEFAFNIDAANVSAPDGAERPIATSISQFLTISGQIDPQNYVEGDLRVVTVLFLDLCGFTALSEKMSPEQITVVVNQCFQHLTDTAVRLGGFVDKYIGDCMMVLFGAPHANDDDAERAIRAAVGMQQALASFSEHLRQRSGIALHVRVGVNTGEVLAGSVGSGQFTAFTVMGDTVNLASRLEQAARVDHILVSESTYELTRDVVRYVPLPPMTIRGKQEPVRAYEVEGLAAGDWSGESPADGFVGRQSELATLERLLADSGHLRSAIVCGPAGSGKSRLAKELCRLHRAETASIRVRCADFVELGLAEATSRLASVLETLTGRSGERYGMPAASSDPPAHGLAYKLVERLKMLADSTCLILVVDGADAADSATMSLLKRVASQLIDCDVLFLFTARDALSGWTLGNTRQIELPPLGADACRRLLGKLLHSDDIEPTTFDRLVWCSGGKPGDLKELVAAGLQSGSLQHGRDGYAMAARLDVGRAFGLRTRIQAELDRLTREEHELLWLGCVVDGPWTPGLAASALGLSAATEALAHLVERGLLTPANSGPTVAYTFRNELTWAVVDASLPQLARRRLHERFALALQHAYDPSRPDPVGLKQIARHFAAAAQHWRGAEYLLRSADLAATTSTPRRAIDHYRAILAEAQTVTDPRQRARLNLELQERIGDALLRDGSLGEAQIAFERAAEDSVSVQRRAELQIKLGVTSLRRGNPRHSLRIVSDVVQDGDVSQETRAGAEAIIALSLSAQGAVDQALEHAQLSLALLSDNPEASALGLSRFAAGRAELLAGRLDAADRELRLSLVARQNAADRTGCAESSILLAHVDALRGEFQHAERLLRSALGSVDVADRTSPVGPPDRWSLANAALAFGRLLADQGDTTRAQRHLNSAFRAAEAVAARELALEARLELDLLQVSRLMGRELAYELAVVVDDLRAVLDSALALGLAPLTCRVRTALAMALCSRPIGDPADTGYAREAVGLAQEALNHSGALGMHLHIAAARRVLATALARLGRWSSATAEFEEAAHELQEAGAVVELLRALIEWARAEAMYTSPPDDAKRRARLERSVQLADTLGLGSDREVAEHLLAEGRV
jgi:class 3 adenylate cyclase/tetratricopeptide (TPR) repeat protein